LIQELSGSSTEEEVPKGPGHVTEISANIVRPNQLLQSASKRQDIIGLYKDACDAETDAIEASRKEISCWCFYAKEFESMCKDFMSNNKVGEKKAKGQVYDFIIEGLPDTKRKTLCKANTKSFKD
jgi:hypothetical protein